MNQTSSILLIIGIGVVLGLVWSYSIIMNIFRIRRTPTGSTNSLPEAGQVELVGHANEAVTQSPISKAPCVIYETMVEEQRSSGKHSHWDTVYHEKSTQVFEITDEYGKIKVAPEDASLVLHDDVKSSSNLFSNFDSGTESALNRLGIATTGLFGLKNSLRVTERYIAAGDLIYVLGPIAINGNQKIISSGSGGSILISDRSEKALLNALYLKIILRILGIEAFASFIIFIIIFNH